jgi:hypothetical protein
MWKEVVAAQFKVLPGIYLERLRETTKYLNQDSRSPGRDFNPGPPEYKGVDNITMGLKIIRQI